MKALVYLAPDTVAVRDVPEPDLIGVDRASCASPPPASAAATSMPIAATIRAASPRSSSATRRSG